MANRLIAYLLVVVFALTAFTHVQIARERAAIDRTYAETARLLYEARMINLRSHVEMVEAWESYRKALAVAGECKSQESGVRSQNSEGRSRFTSGTDSYVSDMLRSESRRVPESRH